MNKKLILFSISMISTFALIYFLHTGVSHSDENSDLIHAQEDILRNDTQKGKYEVYEPQKLLYAHDGKVILFFKADWCASCSVIDEKVLSSLEQIPSGVYIFKVDFDKEIELRKKYGVTLQHTFVQVDEFGDMIDKWSGGITLDDILEKII